MGGGRCTYTHVYHSSLGLRVCIYTDVCDPSLELYACGGNICTPLCATHPWDCVRVRVCIHWHAPPIPRIVCVGGMYTRVYHPSPGSTHMCICVYTKVCHPSPGSCVCAGGIYTCMCTTHPPGSTDVCACIHWGVSAISTIVCVRTWVGVCAPVCAAHPWDSVCVCVRASISTIVCVCTLVCTTHPRDQPMGACVCVYTSVCHPSPGSCVRVRVYHPSYTHTHTCCTDSFPCRRCPRPRGLPCRRPGPARPRGSEPEPLPETKRRRRPAGGEEERAPWPRRAGAGCTTRGPSTSSW